MSIQELLAKRVPFRSLPLSSLKDTTIEKSLPTEQQSQRKKKKVIRVIKKKTVSTVSSNDDDPVPIQSPNVDESLTDTPLLKDETEDKSVAVPGKRVKKIVRKATQSEPEVEVNKDSVDTKKPKTRAPRKNATEKVDKQKAKRPRKVLEKPAVLLVRREGRCDFVVLGSTDMTYTVNAKVTRMFCTCIYFKSKHVACKHIQFVRQVIGQPEAKGDTEKDKLAEALSSSLHAVPLAEYKIPDGDICWCCRRSTVCETQDSEVHRCKCNRVFHSECLGRWFRLAYPAGTCPSCLRVIVEGLTPRPPPEEEPQTETETFVVSMPADIGDVNDFV